MFKLSSKGTRQWIQHERFEGTYLVQFCYIARFMWSIIYDIWRSLVLVSNGTLVHVVTLKDLKYHIFSENMHFLKVSIFQ